MIELGEMFAAEVIGEIGLAAAIPCESAFSGSRDVILFVRLDRGKRIVLNVVRR